MAHAKAVWALGLMSGTSMDGVDAAMLLTDGEQIYDFGPNHYRAYSTAERQGISDALGMWPDGGVAVRVAEEIVRTAHADVIAGFDGVDLVGFHGQTLTHDPAQSRTHQVGDGARLAAQCGLPVVWDFRKNDVAAGGQGAPLAPYFHFACAKFIGADAPLAFLNLGGVGNLTWVDPRQTRAESNCAVLAFDTGPANAPIDDLVGRKTDQKFDADGILAQRGQVDAAVLAGFLTHPYFQRSAPKSLDRNEFSALSSDVDALDTADGCATLVACAVAAVKMGLTGCPEVSKVLVTGGGRRNPAMMTGLDAALDAPVLPVERVGLNGDMLEAQAFAYLAVRSQRSLPLSGPTTTGVPDLTCGGRLSLP